MKQWKQYFIFIGLLILVDLLLAIFVVKFWGDDIVKHLENRRKPVMVMNPLQQEDNMEEESPIQEIEQQQTTLAEIEIAREAAKNERRGQSTKFFSMNPMKNLFQWLGQKLFSRQEAVLLEEAPRDTRLEEIQKMTKLSEAALIHIEHYSKKTGIPISMILAVIEQESRFDKNAQGQAQDRGLMQIIPDTEKWICQRYGDKFNIVYDPKRIFEEEYNIALGTIYLWHLKNAYGEDVHRILTEYNRGYYKSREVYQQNNHFETKYSHSVMKRMEKYQDFDRKELEGEDNHGS
ncbi:MAG: lytic transglycosylase domain-containing protein [Thermotaleaceae bacterium]